MAAPVLAALLCLGHFPPALVVVVGLITVFAGYTAVYALNDLVDLHADREKVGIGGYNDNENYLDGVMVRHPMAKGMLRPAAGLAWACAWAAVALVGAYWLNPVCVYLFVAGCILEGVYCKLWRVTPARALINGAVKTLGALAAVFAVDPTPPVFFTAVLFAWLFAWEIGAQNIPNDWTDIEEDRHFKAKTIPIRFGLHRATLLVVFSLVATLFLNMTLLWASPLAFSPLFLLAALAVNCYFLLYPAYLLGRRRRRADAMALFNKASHYPLAMLTLTLVAMLR